jgi:hypothetical protein
MLNIYVLNAKFINCTYIICNAYSVSLIVCVVLCAVFCLSVVCCFFLCDVFYLLFFV